jgi:hypothetical protein
MLAPGVILKPGLFAFTDANALGGVGVVIVRMPDEEGADLQVLKEIPTNVREIFRDSTIPGLESDNDIDGALSRTHNIFAEMAGLYVSVRELAAVLSGPGPVEATIVHDYVGVGAWMGDKWRLAKDSVLKDLIAATRTLIAQNNLALSYLHQHGHGTEWVGRNDLVRFNVCADALAEQGSSPPVG